ncbi:uncharacterized protein zgc:174935 [Pygocentrus nattereri]|uniref:Uncharacterized protein n=1 Tax=Pygocentrus nattereri TaxID=42514 RepID=A0AAR2JHN3_PYGNA|nr:uncharacterized protein zgc:174935 [Pygocentrus nattereri]
MRSQAFLLTVLVVCSLGLAGYVHHKRKEEVKLVKHASFQNVKHRVTSDVLREYMSHVVESNSLLDKTNKQIVDLTAEVKEAQEASDAKRGLVETCTGDLKHITDEIAGIDTEKNNADEEFKKKKANLQEQIGNLKKEVEQHSKVCDYIKKDSDEGRKLCGLEALPKEPVAKEDKKEEPPKDDKKEEPPKEDKKEEPPK